MMCFVVGWDVGVVWGERGPVRADKFDVRANLTITALLHLVT